MINLNAVEQLLSDATRGPWLEVACIAPDGRRYDAVEGPNDLEVCEIPRTPQGSADSAFIAASRGIVQDLTAAMRAVLKAIDDVDSHASAGPYEVESTLRFAAADLRAAIAPHVDLTVKAS